MPLVHGVRLLLTELNGARAFHNLFCDDVAPLRGTGKKERVISMDVLTISEPSEAAMVIYLVPDTGNWKTFRSRLCEDIHRPEGSMQTRGVRCV
jgi:hypothetical protein